MIKDKIINLVKKIKNMLHILVPPVSLYNEIGISLSQLYIKWTFILDLTLNFLILSFFLFKLIHRYLLILLAICLFGLFIYSYIRKSTFDSRFIFNGPKLIIYFSKSFRKIYIKGLRKIFTKETFKNILITIPFVLCVRWIIISLGWNLYTLSVFTTILYTCISLAFRVFLRYVLDEIFRDR